MENESVGKGSMGSGSIDISSRVDPTSVMPPVNEGPSIESYSVSEAQAEWEKMTTKKEDYGNLPNSIYLRRRNELFKRGFGEKIKQDQKAQAKESQEWLQRENEKIAERNELEADRKARELNLKFFGSEGAVDQMSKKAKEVVNHLSNADKEFLKVCMPNSELAWGDSPLIIGLLANLKNEPDLIQKIRQNGLEHYVALWGKLPRRAQR